jgi:hypothetical protein
MLKQILLTTAVIAMAAASVQSANAKTRQILIDPAGSNDLLLKKGKTQNFLIVKNGQGIPTPQAGVGSANPNGAPSANFIVAPTGGIPTPPVSAGGPSKTGVKTPELLVAQGAGIATPTGGASGGNPGQVQPLLVKTSGGIPTEVASADPGPVSAGGNPAPVIANPANIAATAAADSAAVAPAGAAALPQPAVTPQVSDNGAAPLSPQPLEAAAPAPATGGATGLYATLIAHGFGVEILNFNAHDKLVFYVTTPGNPAEADLLLVDAKYGRVLERKHVAAYADGYDQQTPAYADGYGRNAAGDDGCNHYSDY